MARGARKARRLGWPRELMVWALLAAACAGGVVSYVMPILTENAKLDAKIESLERDNAAARREAERNRAMLRAYRDDPRGALIHDLRNRGWLAPGERLVGGEQEETVARTGGVDAGHP